MLETISGALLPSVVTVFLGYLAARHRTLALKDAPALNRMIMIYALPLVVFPNIIGASRAVLLQNLPLLVVLLVTMISLYGVVFALCRCFLAWTPGMSALAALAASAPNVPFIGSAVLGDLYGAVSGVAVVSSTLLISLTVLPLTMILLVRDAGAKAAQPAGTTNTITSGHADTRAAILTVLREPVIWLSLLGVVMLLLGVSLPALVMNSLALLGQLAAGVTLFISGVIMAAHPLKADGSVLFLVFVKNIVQPMLVLGSLLVVGCANPLLGDAVVTTAFPSIVLIVLLGVKYRVAETEAASALLFSMIASLVTLNFFLVLTGA